MHGLDGMMATRLPYYRGSGVELDTLMEGRDFDDAVNALCDLRSCV